MVTVAGKRSFFRPDGTPPCYNHKTLPIDMILREIAVTPGNDVVA
jgi:hypothetical protein